MEGTRSDNTGQEREMKLLMVGRWVSAKERWMGRERLQPATVSEEQLAWREGAAHCVFGNSKKSVLSGGYKAFKRQKLGFSFSQVRTARSHNQKCRGRQETVGLCRDLQVEPVQ